MVEFGIRLLKAEAKIEDPKRAGGLVLATLVATGLALGIMPSTAEAQTWSPERGAASRVSGQIFNSGVFEAGSAIDRAENAKRDKIEHEYMLRLSQLGEVERELDSEYANEKSRLIQSGTKHDLEKLEQEYKMGKTKIAQDRTELKKEYDKRVRNSRVRGAVIGSVIRGVRGW